MDEYIHSIILVAISLAVFVGSIMAIILRKMERNHSRQRESYQQMLEINRMRLRELYNLETGKKTMGYVPPPPPPDPDITPRTYAYGSDELFANFLRFCGELVLNLFHTLSEICATVGAWLLNSFAPHDKPKRKRKNEELTEWAIGDDGEIVSVIKEKPTDTSFGRHMR